MVNLMDALRQSLQAEGGAAQPSRRPAKKGKKRIDGQREMLLPIRARRKRRLLKAPARPTGRQRKAS